MSKTVPVKELRADLACLLDEVVDRREHVIVTRHGRPAAVIVPIDEYQELEETAEILSDVEALAAIQRGLSDLRDGRVSTLAEVRQDVAERRRRAR